MDAIQTLTFRGLGTIVGVLGQGAQAAVGIKKDMREGVHWRRLHAVSVSVLSFLAVALLVGCATVKLVADYDEETDKGVTALHKQTETFLVKLESVPGNMLDTYDKNKAFYADTKVAISALRVRADATERNSLTVRMLDRLQSNMNRFEADHKAGIDKRELPIYRGGFNSQFTAILAFELAKRRGEKPDEAKAGQPATPVTTQ